MQKINILTVISIVIFFNNNAYCYPKISTNEDIRIQDDTSKFLVKTNKSMISHYKKGNDKEIINIYKSKSIKENDENGNLIAAIAFRNENLPNISLEILNKLLSKSSSKLFTERVLLEIASCYYVKKRKQ